MQQHVGESSSTLHQKLGTRMMREEHLHFVFTMHTYNDTLSSVTAHSTYSTPRTHYVRDLSAARLQLLQQAAWSTARPPAGEPRPTNYAPRKTPPMRRPDARPYHTIPYHTIHTIRSAPLSPIWTKLGGNEHGTGLPQLPIQIRDLRNNQKP